MPLRTGIVAVTLMSLCSACSVLEKLPPMPSFSRSTTAAAQDAQPTEPPQAPLLAEATYHDWSRACLAEQCRIFATGQDTGKAGQPFLLLELSSDRTVEVTALMPLSQQSTSPDSPRWQPPYIRIGDEQYRLARRYFGSEPGSLSVDGTRLGDLAAVHDSRLQVRGAAFDAVVTAFRKGREAEVEFKAAREPSAKKVRFSLRGFTRQYAGLESRSIPASPAD